MGKVISAVFEVESEGFQAMTELKNARETDSYVVSQAMLVKKENEAIQVLDSFDSNLEMSDGAIRGGIIGGLIGVLGGPIGILVGGSIGVMAGNTADIGEAINNATILRKVMEQFADGSVALVALTQDSVEGAAEKMFSKFKVSIIEEDADEVEQEILDAIKLQREMDIEALKQRGKEKLDEIDQKIDEGKEKIKESFEDLKQKIADKLTEKS